MEILGLFLELLGTLSIAHAALSVHHKVLHEHKMDDQVFKVMRRERMVTFFGIGCVIAGFLIQILY